MDLLETSDSSDSNNKCNFLESEDSSDDSTCKTSGNSSYDTFDTSDSQMLNREKDKIKLYINKKPLKPVSCNEDKDKDKDDGYLSDISSDSDDYLHGCKFY